jgi:hypothetical protein
MVQVGLKQFGYVECNVTTIPWLLEATGNSQILLRILVSQGIRNASEGWSAP